MSKQAFVKAGIEATVGELERMFGSCQKYTDRTDRQYGSASIYRLHRKKSFETNTISRTASEEEWRVLSDREGEDWC